VGNADDVPFPRRVQLAVMAHIRHVHTSYDALLKTTKRGIARLKIEPKCLRVLLKWRGEDDEVEIEEREEEVIEIDSDDDSDDELEPYDYNFHHSRRSQDLEIVSWHHNGRHLQIYKEDLPQEYYRPSFVQLVQRGPHYTQPIRPVAVANVNPAYGPSHHSTHLPPRPNQGTPTGSHLSNPILIPDSPLRPPSGYSRRVITDPSRPSLYLHQPPPPPRLVMCCKPNDFSASDILDHYLLLPSNAIPNQHQLFMTSLVVLTTL
jgi:Uncharacterized conserved protein (DUF2293)